MMGELLAHMLAYTQQYPAQVRRAHCCFYLHDGRSLVSLVSLLLFECQDDIFGISSPIPRWGTSLPRISAFFHRPWGSENGATIRGWVSSGKWQNGGWIRSQKCSVLDHQKNAPPPPSLIIMMHIICIVKGGVEISKMLFTTTMFLFIHSHTLPICSQVRRKRCWNIIQLWMQKESEPKARPPHVVTKLEHKVCFGSQKMKFKIILFLSLSFSSLLSSPFPLPYPSLSPLFSFKIVLQISITSSHTVKTTTN